MRGGEYRKVFIEKRKVTFYSAELKFVPLIIDLDKMKEIKDKREKYNLSIEDLKLLYELKKLNDEEAMFKDIVKDFKQSGWKMVLRK
jgi:hypothetical protein